MPSRYDALPDLAFAVHPDYGIVATNPKQLPSSTRMLQGFDFHRVPEQPTLYAMAHPDRDGQARTARAVELLREAGYQVDVDARLDPSHAPHAGFARNRAGLAEPDVAFAEHPQLGIVAALDDRAALLSEFALVERGWRHDPSLDIYTLPATTTRDEALAKVADATRALSRSGVPVAVQPRLAHDVAQRAQASSRASPIAAALATSPARAGRSSQPSAPEPSAPAGAARPADPRIAISRHH